MRLEKKSRTALTLMDVLVGMAMAGIIASVVFGAFITLQRGYNFLVAWSDLNNSLCRVRDSVEQDLRSGTAVTISSGSSASSVQTLTISMPQMYVSGSTGYPPYLTGNAQTNPDVDPAYRAGEPHPYSVLVSGTVGQNGKWVNGTGTNSVAIVYSGSTNTTTKKTWIFRKITWPAGTYNSISWSGSTATRLVASFGNGVNVAYKVGISGTDGSVTYTAASSLMTSGSVTLTGTQDAVQILLSGTTNDRRRPLASGTLLDTVFLRAKSFTNN